MEDVDGYTEEEFQSLLALLDLKNLYATTRDYRGWEGDTPEKRKYIIDTYREAIANVTKEKRNGK